MDLQEAKILFETNSTSFLDQLIPEACRQPVGPSNCTLTIEDRSLIAFGQQDDNHKVLVDLSVLEQISQHWLVILGCIGGMPEVRIDLAQVPSSLRNSVCSIIRNCGHVKHYNLGNYRDIYGKDNPPEDVTVLMDHLKGPTEESQLISYLQMIHKERDTQSICLIPTYIVFDNTQDFLGFMEKWLASETMGYYDRDQFEPVPRSVQLVHLAQLLQEDRKMVKKPNKTMRYDLRSRSERVKGHPPKMEVYNRKKNKAKVRKVRKGTLK